jgi:ubiquinone/menaquinone biosynthesis C-methylase UbiE
MKQQENIKIRDFWNKQANFGKWAGSRDLIAKELEIEAIATYISEWTEILDFGCGNGITAMELARRYNVRILGIDYAEEMIREAEKLREGVVLKGTVNFRVGDIMSLAEIGNNFDTIYTERMIINLPDWQSQKEAIISIVSLLKPGGAYLMCENSQDALNKINSFRARIDLPKISPPWHNRYLNDNEILALTLPDIKLERIDYYSSTYYFLSRIVNAWLAQQNGTEPDYDSPVNHLALRLPPYGDLGQGRIWVWRKGQG